jgi:S1-C subfamily serine protease
MEQTPINPSEPPTPAANDAPDATPTPAANDAADATPTPAPSDALNEAAEPAVTDAQTQPLNWAHGQGAGEPPIPPPNQPPHTPPWASPYPQWHPVPPRPRRRRRIAAAAVGATAIAVALGLGISAATSGGTNTVSGQGSGPTPNSQPAASTSGRATAAQQVGVVDINTVLQYQSAEAAGTGIILTSSGEVLTNNHVIEGATSIKVTVVTTGATYTAKVVGTDASDDVAVLQLQGASGLQTAKIGNSSGVSAGDAVTAVGNGEGQGGTPAAANGTVVATDQTLTASDQNGSNPETLTNMIEINADIVPGYSGGPLYDANGTIIGVDTAASTTASFGGNGTGGFGGGQSNGGQSNGGQSNGTGAETIAYAIPINNAMSIADQIESGQASSTITIGYPAFLGVSMQDSVNGTMITSVADGTPAASAGLQAGDVVTAVNGQAITSATDLQSVISSHKPGDQIQLTWTDTLGQSQTATITLATGPAN